MAIQEERTFFPCITHLGVRLYYIIRNSHYMAEWYPQYKQLYKKQIQIHVLKNLLRCNIKNLLWIKRGRNGYKAKEIGAYKK